MGYGGSQATIPFGGIDMNFISGSPVISSFTREMEFRRAVSNICDSNGNLLFVTNGVYIADATGDTMQNGSGLNPSVYTSWYPDGLPPHQMNIIVPNPGNTNSYYLFHCTVDDPPGNLLTRYLYYSEIDITANGGLGAITTKNQILLNDTLNAGKLTACKHANGRDWWIICHKGFTNIYLKFLLTPSGLFGPFIQSIGVVRAADAGQAQFSPDGLKFAYYGLIEDLDIFSFDRCTGLLSNPVHVAINDSSSGVGVSFSSNSKFLYVSSLRYVYQFDVSAPNIPASQTTVAVWDGFYSPNPPLGTYFDIAQLAPDGKIYISTGNGTLHLHVINQPDSAGLACDLVQHGVPLPAYNFNSLPNHPNYFLGALAGSPCDTLTSLATEVIINPKLNVFPNPNNGYFTLGFNAQKEVGILEIFDSMGRMVYGEKVAQWSQYKQVDITNLPAGIYYCRIKWEAKVAGVKILKE
ncbi:MAG: T9SS type A sorting domain-containing protein [Bacteroidetes bacterium]|nr:T9SS type A sorting domain-containing protein [Bacteroidota bacterium]